MTRLRLIIAPALVLIVCIFGMTSAALCLDKMDMKVLEWNGGCDSGSLDDFMTNLSEAWNSENLILASLPVVFYGDRRAFLCLELAWKSLVISESTVGLLKIATNRQRPNGEKHSRANSSFPSGHATSSFAVAYSVSRYYPRWSVPAFAAASLISYSRVYLDAHYPSDVIVGAGIGILSSYIAHRYLGAWHVDREAFVARLPFRIDVGPGHGRVRVYFSRAM
jgi:membrane-associated phospholipid phosphatase